MIDSIAGLGIPVASPAAKTDDPKKIHDAAQQFESLLISQLLKASREAGDGGWLGTGDDESGAIGVEMAEQQFAQMLAARGGLGVSKLIEQGLRRDAARGKDPAPAPTRTPGESGG